MSAELEDALSLSESPSQVAVPVVAPVSAPAAARTATPGVSGLLAMAVLLPLLTAVAWALTGTLVPELAVFGLGALAVGLVAHQRIQSDAAGETMRGKGSPSSARARSSAAASSGPTGGPGRRTSGSVLSSTLP